MKVLLLEQNDTDAAFIVDLLRQVESNMQVEFVQDRQSVLDFVFCTGVYAARPDQEAPKLILLDVTHDSKTGLELLCILKSYARTRVLPVVMLVGASQDVSLFTSANGCVVWTANRETLCHAIITAARYWLTVNQSVESLDDNIEQLDSSAYSA